MHFDQGIRSLFLLAGGKRRQTSFRDGGQTYFGDGGELRGEERSEKKTREARAGRRLESGDHSTADHHSRQHHPIDFERPDWRKLTAPLRNWERGEHRSTSSSSPSPSSLLISPSFTADLYSRPHTSPPSLPVVLRQENRAMADDLPEHHQHSLHLLWSSLLLATTVPSSPLLCPSPPFTFLHLHRPIVGFFFTIKPPSFLHC